MREKRHWENQISALGGPHYRRYGPKMFDAEGREVPGNRGYKYFGAAKDLPGVRELFEQEPPPPPRKTRAELMKDVDADYYGYRDDDDGVLIPLEEKAEKAAILKALIEWKEKQKSGAKDDEDEEDIYPCDPDVSCIIRRTSTNYMNEANCNIYLLVDFVFSERSKHGIQRRRSNGFACTEIYRPCSGANTERY